MRNIKEFLQRHPQLYYCMHVYRILVHGEGMSLAELQNARYDLQALKVMKKVLTARSVCIDGGAHHGSFLELMCRIAPKASHYAFEPLPHLHAALKQKYPAQRIYDSALSDRSGTATFTHVVDAPAYSGLLERSYDHADPRIEEITVKLAKLDDLIPEHTKIDFIKLDIEGGEYHAMLGALQTIRRHQPVIIFEAGEGSSGHYGVTAGMIFRLVSDEMGYQLSTMARWLQGEPEFSLAAFREAYKSEFFYIAYPRPAASQTD